MTSEQSYPCCDKMNGPAWIDGRYCRPVCEVHGYQTEPEARQHQTSELRPAVAVWWKATDAWKEGLSPEDGTEAAAAVIEADREAVRAEQAAELAKWKALAETLAGELQQIEVDAMEYYNEWRETGCDQKDAIRFAFDLGEETRKALRQYKEARDV